MQTLVSTIFALLVLTLRAQAGNVLVVAPAGAAFTDIQAAIAASSDGDVILVRTGTYSGFSIGDQSLTVAADSGATVEVHGTIQIGPASAARTIQLSALHVPYVTGLPPVGPALQAVSVAGFLRIEGCEVSGAHANGSLSAPDGSRAASFASCAHVLIAHCILSGGGSLQGDVISGPHPGTGGTGIEASQSDLALYDSIVSGGSGDDAHVSYDGGLGGSALYSMNGTAFVSHSIVQGGRGGGADLCCGYGGAGGTAIFEVPLHSVTVLDSFLAGGLGGYGTGCTQCRSSPGVTGGPGAGIVTLQVPFGACRLDGPYVVRELDPITLHVTGHQGDQVGLYLSYAPAQEFIAPWNGVLTVSTAQGSGSRLVRIGTIDASGVLTRTFDQPALGVGVQTQTRYLQVRIVRAGMTNVLSSPLAVIALDAAF